MPPKRWRRNALASPQGLPFTWRPRVHGVYMAVQSGRASSATNEEGFEVQPPVTPPQNFDTDADEEACEVITAGCDAMLEAMEEWLAMLPQHLRGENIGQEIEILKQDATMLISKVEDVLQYGCVRDTTILCSQCVTQYERLKDTYKGLKHDCQPFLSNANKRARNAD